MRRWFAVLLLCLLPFQLSWAAVEGYCAHDAGGSADLAGHHGHASHDAGSPAGDAGETDDASIDVSSPDCGHHCHGGCVGLVDMPAPRQPLAAGDAPTPLGQAPGADHVSARPDRPKWVRLA